jgi:SAM-dependent methyltransferase
MLALEERELRRVLPDVFGRFCVQVGTWGRSGSLLAAAGTVQRLILGTVRDGSSQVLVDPAQLPLLSKSVDAVVLPHSLEFMRSPHPLLREVNRVLTDRGVLLVLGFNPWSWWGLRRHLGLGYRAFPGGTHFYSARRLCDWLELLDFEITQIRRYGAGFPWGAAGTGGALSALSDAYLLVARKRVIPMTWSGRVQRAVVRPIIGGVAMPEARWRS